MRPCKIIEIQPGEQIRIPELKVALSNFHDRPMYVRVWTKYFKCSYRPPAPYGAAGDV